MCRVAEPPMPLESGAGKTKYFAVPACSGHQVIGIQKEGNIVVSACQLGKDEVAKVLKAVVSQGHIFDCTWNMCMACKLPNAHLPPLATGAQFQLCVYLCVFFLYVHQSSKVRAPRSCSASLPLSQRKIFFAAFSVVMFREPLGYHTVMH